MGNEQKTSKILENASAAIQEAVNKGNIVWISTATGERVLLDNTCKIEFMHHRH